MAQSKCRPGRRGRVCLEGAGPGAADTAAICTGSGEAGAVLAALLAHGVPLDRPVAVVETA